MSNLFFNVIDDQIQEVAATTIALTLAQLLNTDNLGLDSGGITFIQTNQVSQEAGGDNRREVTEFIRRCVNNIQESPESMQAGLSSLLLKTISITSVTL